MNFCPRPQQTLESLLFYIQYYTMTCFLTACENPNRNGGSNAARKGSSVRIIFLNLNVSVKTLLTNLKLFFFFFK